MSVIALANSKGGCGKSTLALCLAYSKAFKKAYKRIALVELDRQGTLNSWHSNRDQTNDGTGVAFDMLYSTKAKQAAGMLEAIYHDTDCMVLDLPGESEKGFATGFGIAAADIVIVPIQNSTADLDAFGEHLLPGLQDLDAFGKTVIVPAFVHPAANKAKTRNTFQDMMPSGIRTAKNYFPSRSVFKYFGDNGETLNEYAAKVKGNKREYAQAQAAQADIEGIAREVIKYAG